MIIGLSFETQEAKGELKQTKKNPDPYNHITLKVLNIFFSSSGFLFIVQFMLNLKNNLIAKCHHETICI
jgi:hypothetical protein